MINITLVLIFFLSLFFRIYIFLFVPLRPYVAESVLFLDLINNPMLIPSWLGIGFGLINLLLIILISKNFLRFNLWFIPGLIYAISPWAGYLEVGGSLYIPVLTFLLLIFMSLKIFSKEKWNMILLIGASVALLYTSLLNWIMLPCLIFSIYKLKVLTSNKLKIYIISLTLFCLPLFISAALNMTALKNIISNQASVFAEVGLINTVNVFRGETAQTKFAMIGRFVENRYFYLSQHLIFNFLKHITPVAYFTPEFKMFDFSFSPPILLGFLMPFLFGVKSIFDLFAKNKWISLTFLALILPSIISKNSPDLNRLILIAPAIFIIIGIGFKDLLSRKTIIYKFLLVITFILVLTQMMTVLSDIYFREAVRLYQIKS